MAVCAEKERELLAAALGMGLNRTFMLSFSSLTLCISDRDGSGRAFISDAPHNLTFPSVQWCEHVSSCSGKQFGVL